MKSITKRDIVLHLKNLPAKVLPTHTKFAEECQKFVCERLSIKPAHLNAKLGAMVKDIIKFYRTNGLYFILAFIFVSVRTTFLKSQTKCHVIKVLLSSESNLDSPTNQLVAQS